MARQKQERNIFSRFLIVDAQSVKNTDTAGQKGYDAGKKVSGIKRHIAVDTQGLPHAIAVTTAEVTDRKGALRALERCQSNLTHVQSLLCDRGWSSLKNPLQAPSAVGDSGTALKDDHPIARIQARKNAIASGTRPHR